MRILIECISGIVAVVMCASAAIAQSRDPLQPVSPPSALPAIKPESAFSDYRRFGDEPKKSWAEANREVAENPGMGSMQGMAGPNMAGMDSKAGAGGHDMSSMPGMTPKSAGTQKPQVGTAGHDMSSMPDMAPKAAGGQKPQASAGGHDMSAMPDMTPKSGGTQKPRAGAAGHDMDSMKGMPGMGSKAGGASTQKAPAGHDMASMQAMPGMAPKSGAAAKGHDNSAGPDHHSSATKSMPGMDKPMPNASAGKEGHGAMAMSQSMPSKAMKGPDGPVYGTGVVRSVDKAGSRVRVTHDPIDAMEWPKMTLSFRLKDSSLADRVKEGDVVEFSIEKSNTGYVISDLKKRAPSGAPQSK